MKSIKDMDSNKFLIIGDEVYLKEYYEDKMRENFEFMETDSFNYHEFKGGVSELDSIEDAVQMPPAFSNAKVVFIKNISIHTMNKDEIEILKRIIAECPEETNLIISESSDGFGKPTNKDVKKIIKVCENSGGIVINATRGKSDKDLTKFTIGYLKNKGVSINPPNAKLLCEYCYKDMEHLTQEMDKLALYVIDGEVTKEVIDSLVVPHFETSVFSLAKEIMSRNFDGAMNILANLKNNEEEPIMILNALSLNFIDLFRSKVAIMYNKTSADVSADFKYGNRAFVLNKSFQSARNMPIKKINNFINIIDKADFQLKSGFFDPFVAIEIAITKLIKNI